MSKPMLFVVAALSLTACASSAPTHYNHLRINAADPLHNRIEYRDLTRAYPVELPLPIQIQPHVEPEAAISPPQAFTDQPSIFTAVEQSAEVVNLAESTEVQLPNSQCRNTGFTFQPGMLRENLSRVLTECGYSVGEWALGDEDFLIDYPIRGRFTVQMPNGIDDILNVVETEFAVSGRINPITQTVDFFALDMPLSGDLAQ